MQQMLGRRFEDGVDLSAGQWQKIALARAYMRDAQVLILDEPTASLDARAEYEVFLRFADLTRDKMAVLISHRFSTVRMADRILVLDDGEVDRAGDASATGGAGRPLCGAVRVAGGGLSLASSRAIIETCHESSQNPRIRRTRGPEDTRTSTVPTPKPTEVLLRVKACALNHLDLWIRQGMPKVKNSAAHFGQRHSGEVTEVGDCAGA